MTHAMGLRATSLAASGAMLSVLVLAALSVSVTMQRFDFPDAPAIPLVEIRTQPPQPPARELEAPPPAAQTGEASAAPVQAPPSPLPPQLSAAALGVAAGPPLITDPRWLERPRDLARYYPRRALERGVTGVVTLDCMVALDGALRCAVLSETPPNWGFAAAALRIAGDHRMVPAQRDGAAVEGQYRMRVPFELR